MVGWASKDFQSAFGVQHFSKEDYVGIPWSMIGIFELKADKVRIGQVVYLREYIYCGWS